jgi:hypothetical protein
MAEDYWRQDADEPARGTRGRGAGRAAVGKVGLA